MPEEVEPGEEGEIRFPEGDIRGPGFIVERHTEDGWEWVWAFSHDPEAHEPRTWTAEAHRERGIAWDDGPAFSAVEGQHLPILEGAQPGRHRVCTAARDPALCAEFDILRTGD